LYNKAKTQTSSMKKVFIATIFVSFVAILLTSCGAARYGAGKGCPTTNPRYFKG